MQSSFKGGDIPTPMLDLTNTPLLLLPAIPLTQPLTAILVQHPVLMCLYLCHSPLNSRDS